MTKFYAVNGSYFVFNSAQQDNVVDRLPAGNYVVKQHSMSKEYFFEKYDKENVLPTKIYGNTVARSERIINTFLDRQGSTGVLLSGEKGSGKTMLGKMVSNELNYRHQVPTIYVSEPHTSQAFMELIGNLTQPAVIFFDEVEKVYNGKESENFGFHDQQAILTLLDGVFSTQILFILTCNDKWLINDHMINRPGRLYYSYDYKGLEEDFVREYCADNLKSDATDEVVKVTNFFGRFNFDMLKALVEEMNRYGESAKEVLAHLNINPERDDNEYEACLIPVGSTEPLLQLNPGRCKNPLSWKDQHEFYTYELPASYSKKKRSNAPTTASVASLSLDDDEDNHYTQFYFSSKDIKLSTDQGFELVNEAGEKLILIKKEKTFDWRAF